MRTYSPLISLQELIALQTSQNVILIDASNSKTAKSDYNTSHLKGALFVDTNTELSNTAQDPKFGGRHPLPSLEDFS
ncbi:hypothetical protein N8328_00810 [Crocinitomicaceae bacterium]|jgi:thiosulfate/3-mercaptopyruvate sulfurtransferase|nr:hypothetical protein [Crocinitomicaceae bacterium]